MESSRLRLRRFNSSDLTNLSALESDSEVVRFTSMRKPFTVEQSRERLRSLIDKENERAPLGVWAVETKVGNEFVGWFMLLKTQFEEPELGFMILKKQWGKGYATEAAQRLIAYAFDDLKLSSIMARIDTSNHSSRQVLQKLGFQYWKTESAIDKVLQIETVTEFFKLIP